jgi:glycosidase
MNRICLLLLVLALSPFPAVGAGDASPIQRIEPPNWWTGFRHPELQLLIYGPGIAAYHPDVDHAGVRVLRAERGSSPNYLFVYLHIDAEAQPGVFDLVLKGPDGSLVQPYELLTKNADPGHARGFDASDAIYLITPDRFANGDPANDTIDGFGDPADRSDPDGRHGGDIEGIASGLDYIADMGFTAIWLNPLLENRMPHISYHGYATTDFYRVDPRFGSNESYRELVARGKAMGIGVIMDMIVNHIGSSHWWMADLPADDWLNFQGDPRITSHEHITEQDPHASEWDRRMYSDGWFDKKMPDLNQRNPLLADYLTQNAIWWIEYLGLTGIRMDTYPYPDKHYMTDWTRRVMLEYPDFNIVGEEWTDNPAAVAYWQRGQHNHDGYVSHLPSLMDFPLQNALRWGLVTAEGSKMEDLRPGGLLYLFRALANDFVYPDPTGLVIFPDNHDMSRIYSQLGEDYDLWRMAIAYVLTMRGVPQIYYGTEILMKNPGTEAHGTIRSDFPGGWAGDARNAFTGEGLSMREKDAQAYLRKLLNWRRDTAVLHHGKTLQFVPEHSSYVYFRYDEQDSVMVAFNKQGKEQRLALDRFQERLASYRHARDVITGEKLDLSEALLLPPRSVRVLELLK